MTGEVRERERNCGGVTRFVNVPRPFSPRGWALDMRHSLPDHKVRGGVIAVDTDRLVRGFYAPESAFADPASIIV